MPQKQIKTIKLENGDDIVTALPEQQYPDKHSLIRLEKPMQIKYVPQMTEEGWRDYIVLVKWVAYTQDSIVTIPKHKIMAISNASEEMVNTYSEVVKEYHLQKIVEEDMDLNYEAKSFDAESNKQLQEIFHTLEDEEPTFH